MGNLSSEWELACSDEFKKGRHVFSLRVDRALGRISGQAWTEIMTVRSGSARVCHRPYHHKYTQLTRTCTLQHLLFSLPHSSEVSFEMFWCQHQNYTICSAFNWEYAQNSTSMSRHLWTHFSWYEKNKEKVFDSQPYTGQSLSHLSRLLTLFSSELLLEPSPKIDISKRVPSQASLSSWLWSRENRNDDEMQEHFLSFLLLRFGVLLVLCSRWVLTLVHALVIVHTLHINSRTLTVFDRCWDNSEFLSPMWAQSFGISIPRLSWVYSWLSVCPAVSCPLLLPLSTLKGS